MAKLPTTLCMSKTNAHIKLWTLRHPKKYSLVTSFMFLILEFLVVPYIFMCRKRRNKLDASRKKGTFVGYNEISKAYRIYVSGQREVELSHDVTFDEDSALRKIRDFRIPKKDNDDADAKKQNEPPFDEPMPNVEGPMDPIDPPPSEPFTSKKRPLWLKNTLEDAEKHIAPRGTFRESKKSNKYQGYLASMSTIVQSEQVVKQ